MDIELQAKLLKLKGYLNEINHISYTYAQIGKNNPMNYLSEDSARKMIAVYEDLLKQVKSLILNYEQSAD
jgi:hypothetical protein